MLAESVLVVLPGLQARVVLSLALFHQLLPHSLRLFHTQRELQLVVRAIPELRWQFAERSDLVNLLGPVLPLLRRDTGC